MRIDLVLKYLCLVKSRSLAKALCEKERVLLNGDPTRSSAAVRCGDRVTVQFQRRAVTVVLDRVPEKQLSKSTALTYYRSVDTPAAERPVDPLDDL
jgi:ribosomal 50S subunit-recycling heat shock protein